MVRANTPDGKTYGIKFTHRVPTKNKRGKTTCELVEVYGTGPDSVEVPVSTASATPCAGADSFSKASGRRASFEKAVQAVESREVRTSLWTALRSHCRITPKS